MKSIKAYTLDSFARSAGGGNPAGVVLNAEGLTEHEMQKIAGAVGFSETAFVMPSELADFRVRFFTPTEEVDLCGHATIGTFFLMAEKGLVQPGVYTQETKAGVLEVAVGEDHLILMDQTAPLFFRTLPKEEIAASLNIAVSDMPEDLPVQMISTGMKDIMVPVKSIAILNGAKPDMDQITEISRKYDAIGYHMFALETLHGGLAQCRNFAPLYGIPEESATGTSNGALSSYIYHYGKITEEEARHIVIEQGYSMGKPSEIFASLQFEGGEITRVKVGGKAMNIAEMTVEY